MKTIRLIELFAGYGSQAMALKRLGIPFEHYKVVEFDKYAIKSYNAVHGTNFDTTDIRDVKGEDLETVDDDNYTYLLTYSFPCTDLSIAGKMQGMKKGSGTRSGLLWEAERILTEIAAAQNLRLPQVLLMENVPQVHGEQNVKDFGNWITFLDSLGYVSKWQDLNAKNYGVAQNRERCFMVSYLDKSLKFAFPSPIKLTKTAKDYLEETVNEKYYIKTDKADDLIRKLVIDNELDSEDIKLRANTKQGYIELENGGLCDLSYPDSTERRGRSQTRPRVCPTITSSGDINKIDRCVKIGDLGGSYELASRVYATEGISPAITVHEGYIPKILDNQVVDLSTTCPKVKTLSNCLKAGQRGISKHQGEETGVLEKTILEERTDEGLRTFGSALSGALRTTDSCGDKRVLEKCIQVGAIDNNGYESRNRVNSVGGCFTTLQTKGDFNSYILVEYRIRKLTPLECLRLMDVTDEDAKKIIEVNSDTQVYKQAGNSIVVSVMVAIFNNIFCGGSEKEKSQIDIFDILDT